MRTFLLLLVILLAVAVDGKAIRKRRAISEFSSDGDQPSIVFSQGSNDEQITSYKSMLEMLLRQLSDIEKKHYPAEDTSAEVADQYQRDFYTQAASDIVQKLIQYGALSAIVDAEEAAFYEDTDGQESKEAAASKDEEPAAVQIAVKIEESAPSAATDNAEETLTVEQAHEILKLIIDELMNKFFADYMKNGENTRVYVIGAGDSHQQEDEEDEEADPTEESAGAEEEEEGEEGDSSSSSSSSEEDYFYRDSDEYADVVLEADDDAVLVVNKQVSTNIIRIPAATFVDALTKLLPALKSDKYPAQLQKLTPLQIEDARVYSEHGEPSLIVPKPVSGPLPSHVSAHSVAPIASVAPTAAAAAAAPATTKETEYYHRAFDLGHVLLCLAAGLLSMWAIAQLVSMHRRRSQSAGPAPAMELPPKVIPAIIPNIYATPPAVLTKTADPEKPPVYVENPTFTKPEDKPEDKPAV